MSDPRPLVTLVAALAVGAAAVMVAATPAGALTTHQPSTTTDELDGDHSPGDLSLREAVALAQQDGDASVIQLAPGATYQLACIGVGEGPLSHAPSGGPEPLRIEGNGAATQHGLCPATGASQQCLGSREQLLEVKRFRDVVVGARLQTLDLVLPAIAGGEDQNGVRLGLAAQRADQIEAGQLRQSQIDDREVERVLATAIQPFFAIGGLIDREARFLELLRERFTQRRFVFDDQYAHQYICPV